MPICFQTAAKDRHAIARRLWRLFPAALLPLALFAAACTQAPITGRQQLILMSESEAAQMGADAYREIIKEKGVAKNPDLQRRVDQVGGRISRVVNAGYNWEFTLLNDDTANAFALPGGKVGVNMGLFKVVRNDAQLAAVIGHEIGHVMARHSSERMSQQVLTQTGINILGSATDSQAMTEILVQAATLGIQLPFSRTQEAEADELGVHYMARAGYDPREAIQVWRNFANEGGDRPPEFLSTHPSPSSRIQHLQGLMPRVLPIYQQNGGSI